MSQSGSARRGAGSTAGSRQPRQSPGSASDASRRAPRTTSSGTSALELNAAVMGETLAANAVARSRGRPAWEEEEEELVDSDDERKRRNQIVQASTMPPGLDWLGGVVNPIKTGIDDFGKNLGQLFCPFMVVTQDTLVKEYCEDLEKERSTLASQNAALAQELEKLKMLNLSSSKRKKPRAKSELDKYIDLRILLSNLGKDGKLSEEEHCLRTCWAAWDARDRPLKDLIAARGAGRSGSPPSPRSSGAQSRSSSRAGSPGRRGSSLRGEDTSMSLPLSMMDTPAQKACATANWVVTMLQVKQVNPESVTVDEVGPLLGLMYSFAKEEKVQAAGAEALALIAMDESETSRVTPEDLVEEGAITVMLTAMKTHRNNSLLQEQAGSALLHMASRSSDVAVEIRQAGGQRAIAAAIKLHPQLKYLRTYLDELLQDGSPAARLAI